MISTESRSFLKRLLIIAAFVFLILGIAGVSTIAFVSYSDYRAEQVVLKHREDQRKIREMISFCAFAKIMDTEQADLDKCGDDIEAVRFVLLKMINTRLNFWEQAATDLNIKMKTLIKYKKDRVDIYWNAALESAFQDVARQFVEQANIILQQSDEWRAKEKALKEGKIEKGIPPVDTEKGRREIPKMKI